MGKQVIYVRPDRQKPLTYQNVTFKSSEDFTLMEEDLRKAREELHETEELKIASLEKFRDKINDDPAMRYNTDENYLLRYLRYAKYDVERAYKQLRNFYVFRQNHPHIFDLSNTRDLINSGFVRYLPYADEDGCLVFHLRFKKWNVNEWTIWDFFSLYHALSDILTLNPNVQIHGIKALWDLKGFSYGHIVHTFNIKLLMTVATLFQEIYPYRIRKVVCFHTSSSSRTAYNMFCPILKTKLRDRIVMLGSDLKELHKHFSPAILPKEYGGRLEESQCSIERHVIDNMKYVEQERQFGPIIKN